VRLEDFGVQTNMLRVPWRLIGGLRRGIYRHLEGSEALLALLIASANDKEEENENAHDDHDDETRDDPPHYRGG